MEDSFYLVIGPLDVSLFQRFFMFHYSFYALRAVL